MRKRSKYRPKPVIRDTVNFVLNGMKPIDTFTSEAITLRARNHSAMVDAVQGQANKSTVDILIAALNVTEALAVTAKLGGDWREEIHAAQDALLSMARRGVKTDRFVFTGPELTAMNLAMELHDEQLSNCTVAQLEKAVAHVNHQYRSGAMRRIIPKVSDETPPTAADSPRVRQARDSCGPTRSHRDQACQDHGGA